MQIPSALNSVAADPPSLPEAAVADAVAQQYGLRGDYRELVSERDQNFKLTTTSGEHFVVKATSFVQDPVVTDFQIAVLLHLEKLWVPGVPRIVRTSSGAEHGEIVLSDGAKICLRIVTFLHGRLLEDCVPTPAIAEQLGRRLAELDIALQDFSHAGDSQVLLWDTQRAGELRSLLIHVEDASMRQHLEAVLDAFDQHVTPALPGLPRQVIHNDAHNENILIGDNGDIAGIIDFGDMLMAPRIQDLSTAAAYLRADGDDPMQLIAPLVRGYHEKNPLQASELAVLFDMVRTRLSMTLILFYWRLSAREKGDPYRQKLIEGERDAYGFLQKLSLLGQAAFLARLFQK
ncbi:MAG: phosphotransferase [Gammaproteobacteria bacterium]|nr:phosphotransferase [Gammaproteobacteria bacterium]MDH5240761.1 phosphotransferase [Gammaproteobacteria bacterium]MDH5583403.1 phosphotransferase [Gammaproteobacteria bacterium]